MSRRFTRRRGRLVLTLWPAEVALLRDLSGQVAAVVAGEPSDPGVDRVRDRLFPRAYLDPTEDTAETEWQAVVHPDLVRAKRAALADLLASLDAGATDREDRVSVALDPDGVERWVAALNDLRLALGVTLGVTQDTEEVDESDPRASGLEAYRWLTYLQGEMVEEMLGT